MKKTLFLLCIVFFSCSNENFNDEKILDNSRSMNKKNVLNTDYEYLLFDYQDQIISYVVPGHNPFGWFQAHNWSNYPALVNPYSSHFCSVSLGSINQMSFNQYNDNGSALRIHFPLSAPDNVELFLWDYNTKNITNYSNSLNSVFDFDTDNSWDNLNSFYFFTQYNFFQKDISEFANNHTLCLRLKYN